MKAWERRERESERAYRAFLVYRDLGLARSLAGVREQSGDRPIPLRTIERWSARWAWPRRAAAWDAWLQAARDRVARREAGKWERRRLAALEAVYEDVQKIRERLQLMLSFPLTRRRTEDGRTVIEPARWSFRDVIAGLKAAAELEAMALNAATTDPELMSDAEVAGVLDALDDAIRSGPGAATAGGPADAA